ncbi:MAG: SIMPL domain-containing protein [Bryobacteraceae bacterium]
MPTKLALAFLTSLTLLYAQETSSRRPPSVRAHGESIVSAKPDQARIHIGVTSEAPTGDAAAAENAKQLASVLDGLKKALGPSAEIKTIAYNIHPIYRHPKDGGAPSIGGYTATNTVEVTLKDIANVGKIIDVATQAGANNIQNIQFELQDEQKVRAQALREAAREARSKAEALASALGLRIVGVLAVEEEQPVNVQPVRRFEMAAMAASARVPTPVEPGNVQVRATVTVVAEVAP